LLGNDTCNLFKSWCTDNGVKYEIDAKKLGVRISNLNIAGVEKGRHTNKGWTKIYDITKLKKHFKLGCIVKLSEPDTEELEEENY
jgi:hypothetical protein